MHLEVLVEDQSGANAVCAFLEKILASGMQHHTYRIHSYRGIGKIPKDLRGKTDPQKRILLDRLPRLLRGYGKSLQHIDAAVLVVLDLDDRECVNFKQELLEVLRRCRPRPTVLFRIAIEEVESWLLGDRLAIKEAYPDTRDDVLDTYKQDSICGTWEKLADVIYPGGSSKLKEIGYPLIGEVKCEWARKIGKLVDVERNQSKSFQVFRDGVRRLVGKYG